MDMHHTALEWPTLDENSDFHQHLLAADERTHTMGKSLAQYLELKIHSSYFRNEIKEVRIKGKFDRSQGISENEKSSKQINYMRPTANLDNGVLHVNCFPGFDYVFHYGCIYQSYSALIGRDILTFHEIPSDDLCWSTLAKSGLDGLPNVETVIIGKVEQLKGLSDENRWKISGYFIWKNAILSSGPALLLGCKHTIWGEIAGRIIYILAQRGVKRVIFTGKLGALNPCQAPNCVLASGETSILPDGTKVRWNNLFKNCQSSLVHFGRHVTMPSTLAETSSWFKRARAVAEYVESEIGYMAKASVDSGITFSYLHIVSDNLAQHYSENLSNERDMSVIRKRTVLSGELTNIIKKI